MQILTLILALYIFIGIIVYLFLYAKACSGIYTYPEHEVNAILNANGFKSKRDFERCLRICGFLWLFVIPFEFFQSFFNDKED